MKLKRSGNLLGTIWSRFSTCGLYKENGDYFPEKRRCPKWI